MNNHMIKIRNDDKGLCLYYYYYYYYYYAVNNALVVIHAVQR